MGKFIRIKFEATASFDVIIEMSDDEIQQLQELCKKENPFLTSGDPLHTAIMINNTIVPDDFDYLYKNVDLEEIEFEEYKNP